MGLDSEVGYAGKYAQSPSNAIHMNLPPTPKKGHKSSNLTSGLVTEVVSMCDMDDEFGNKKYVENPKLIAEKKRGKDKLTLKDKLCKHKNHSHISLVPQTRVTYFSLDRYSTQKMDP